MPDPRVLLLPLAAWRLSYMLVIEVGPFDLIKKLRFMVTLYLEKNNMMGTSPFDCLKCMSVWVSAFLLLCIQFPLGWWVVAWLALSALTILAQEAWEYIRYKETNERHLRKTPAQLPEL